MRFFSAVNVKRLTPDAPKNYIESKPYENRKDFLTVFIVINLCKGLI